jgi:hypothetical protein
VAYTTLAETKSYLGETGSSNDTLLTALLTAAEATANHYCLGSPSASLLSTAYVERTDGGSALLTMRYGPITAVTKIEVGYETLMTVYDSSLPDAANMILVLEKKGRCLYLNAVPGTYVGLFTPTYELTNRRDVQVSYTAGYATAPANLKLAIWKLVALMFSAEKRAAEGVSRFKTGEVEVDFEGSRSSSSTTHWMSKDIEQLLAPFKQYDVA